METNENMSAPLYERDPDAWRAHLAEGNVRQARKRVSADALIRDGEGRILIVKPSYKPGWDLPGGMAEANEPPLVALHRELQEELDLRFDTYKLICIDWVPPHGPWDDLLAFIFDAGTLPDDIRNTLSLHDDELTAYRFAEANELSELLKPRLSRRLQAALDGLEAGSPVCYLQDGYTI